MSVFDFKKESERAGGGGGRGGGERRKENSVYCKLKLWNVGLLIVKESVGLRSERGREKEWRSVCGGGRGAEGGWGGRRTARIEKW